VTPALRLSPTATGVRLEVRVMPRSPRNGVDGVRDGRLVVRVTAPPVDGAANEAVADLVASALDVPRRAVVIAAGASGRNKIVDARGVTETEARARLQALLDAAGAARG
jgi:uncharacterized protein (TIGR00251 family)